MARKFQIIKSDGGKFTVHASTKWEANRYAKSAESLLGWKVVRVIEIKQRG